MTDEDKKLIELYLQDDKKKKYIFAILIISLAVFIFGMAYLRKNNTDCSIDNNVSTVDENKQNNVNENNKNNISNQEPKTTEKKEVSEPKKENDKVDQSKTNTSNEVEQPKQENNKVVEPQKEEDKTVEKAPSNNNSTTENKSSSVPVKPANKDFLFTEGYTMDNVTQAAENYLKQSGYSGRCEPLKDGEGIYIGMRVTFD